MVLFKNFLNKFQFYGIMSDIQMRGMIVVMNYEKALKELYKGKKITRQSWEGEAQAYLELPPFIISKTSQGNATVYQNTEEDLAADDWVEFKGFVIPEPEIVEEVTEEITEEVATEETIEE